MILNRLARAFHVLAKSVGGMATGKHDLPNDCQQETE